MIGQYLLEICSCAAELRLGSIFTDAQRFGYFLVGIPVNGIHVKYDPVACRKFLDHFQKILCLQVIAYFAIIRLTVSLFKVRFEIHTSVFSQECQRFIHDDPSDPTLKTSFSFKLVDTVKYLGKSSYENILCFHGMAHIAIANPIHFRGKKIKKLLLRVAITPLATLDEFVFFGPVNFKFHLRSADKMLKWEPGLLNPKEFNHIS